MTNASMFVLMVMKMMVNVSARTSMIIREIFVLTQNWAAMKEPASQFAI
jgi:hypothetical protein